MDLCGRPLTIEVGKVAELASASAMVKYGDTTVMVAVTVSPRPRDGIDFFPLSVEFEEKLYAVGRIPGSFMRREGRPSLPAVLASRLIDRPMRPLFPYDFRNDVCIQCTVMSVDYDCSPEVAAMIGASACVSYSEIPFAGPIGCLEVDVYKRQVTGCAATNCYGVKGMAVRSKTDGLVHLLKRESMAKGVKVYYNEDGTVSIELHIIVENGVNLVAVCRSIMSEVRYVVSKTTGVEVKSVDVCVDSMRF